MLDALQLNCLSFFFFEACKSLEWMLDATGDVWYWATRVRDNDYNASKSIIVLRVNEYQESNQIFIILVLLRGSE